MWKVGTSSRLNPFRRAVNGVMAFGLCPPINVQDGEACKRPGQVWCSCMKSSAFLSWANKYSELKGLLLRLLSQLVRCRQARCSYSLFKCCVFCGYLVHLLFFPGWREKRGPEIAGGAVEEYGFPCGSSHRGPFFTERKKLIWACSNPCIRLPFSTAAAPWLYLTPSETKWTWSNWTSLTPDRSTPMGV